MAIFKVVAQNFDLIDELNQTKLTGKITCEHLFHANAFGTLIGHPEIGDDLPTVSKKIQDIISLQEKHPDALPFNVVMLGESYKEFSDNSLQDIALLIKNRCSTIFNDIPDVFIKNVLLIYQPKWGINQTGVEQLPPSVKLITRVTNKMRDFLSERLGPAGLNVSLMYGEISSPTRAVEILANENLQGLMMGSACRTTEQVIDIVKAIQFAYEKRKIILVCNFKAFNLEESYQEYIDALNIVPDNFTFYFVPPATDITKLVELTK
ncbi:MAG: triosephosphate isomerase [Asgard group archaeon]|nr:triosephosphate isomerase [Asgard group archaeon]